MSSLLFASACEISSIGRSIAVVMSSVVDLGSTVSRCVVSVHLVNLSCLYHGVVNVVFAVEAPHKPGKSRPRHPDSRKCKSRVRNAEAIAGTATSGSTSR